MRRLIGIRYGPGPAVDTPDRRPARGGAAARAAYHSARDADDDLRSGALVRVDLAEAGPDGVALWAVYPSARHVAPKLRAVLDALEAALAAPG